MAAAARQTRQNRRSYFLAATGTAVLTLALTTQDAASHTGQVVVPPRHATGHVHNHDDQTWPPQPRGLTGVRDFSQRGAEQVRRLEMQRRFGELERHGSSRMALQQALGRRFARIAIADEEDKAAGPRGSRFTYFSHEKNATVEVHFEGDRIQSVRSIAAEEYQPEITDDEIAEAARLARAEFVRLGLARVESLKAYGILAYRPEGKGFYDRRVIYVSFHAGDDAPPELMAWVDLTGQTILKTRTER